MKSLFASLFALALPGLAMAHNANDTQVTYTADVTSSTVTWKGYKVTGKHHGTVALKSGTLIFDNNMLVGGEFVIDMTTIRNTDMAGSGGAEKLEGHLKSDDFFGVQKYPSAKFVISKVIPYGTNGDYRIYGDLTIKGITKPIKFMSNVKTTGGSIAATADITIDRSEFDVRFGSGSFFDNLGDKAIHDDFDLGIEMTLNPA